MFSEIFFKTKLENSFKNILQVHFRKIFLKAYFK
jgi:hypothetical protein